MNVGGLFSACCEYAGGLLAISQALLTFLSTQLNLSANVRLIARQEFTSSDSKRAKTVSTVSSRNKSR